MHVATYKGFVDEMEKIAAGISPTLVSRPVLKAFHPGAHGFETLAKGLGDTKVMRAGAQAAQAAPAVAGRAMGAVKSLGQGLMKNRKAIGIGAAGAVAGDIAGHQAQKSKQDQAGYAHPG